MHFAEQRQFLYGRRARPVRCCHRGADAVPAHEEEVDRAQGDPERRGAGGAVLRRAAVHGDPPAMPGRSQARAVIAHVHIQEV